MLQAFPHTPINIEIKGRDDDEAQFLHNADVLAALLKNTKRRDLIVVSFNQDAVDRFHAQVPQVDVAPGIDGIAGVPARRARRRATAWWRCRSRSPTSSAARR